MEQLTLHECKTCGTQSCDFEAVFNCEASHVELTPEDKLKYENLKEAVKVAYADLTCDTDDKYKVVQVKSLKELVDFEETHGIIQV